MADNEYGHYLVSFLCVIPLTMCIQNPQDKLFWPLGGRPRASHILGKYSTTELFPQPLNFEVTTILSLLLIQAQLLFLCQ